MIFERKEYPRSPDGQHKTYTTIPGLIHLLKEPVKKGSLPEASRVKEVKKVYMTLKVENGESKSLINTILTCIGIISRLDGTPLGEISL